MSSVNLAPLENSSGLKTRVYTALREAILSMDIYSEAEPPRLDERRLAENLGVSRTPVREALSRLEQEGLVRNIPRRGCFPVRKSKREIVEIIQVWAALESMAARLVTLNASDRDLQKFRKHWENQVKSTTRVVDTVASPLVVSIDEYSESNIQFHQQIMSLAGNQSLLATAEALFAHMHTIRSATIHQRNRSTRSIIDHGLIIDALVARRTDVAEQLVRDHALELADHVKTHVDYLE